MTSTLRVNRLQNLDNTRTVSVEDIATLSDIGGGGTGDNNDTEYETSGLTRVIYVDTVEQLKQIDYTNIVDGQVIKVTSTGRAGDFVIHFENSDISDPQEGIYVDLGLGVHAKRIVDSWVNVSWFGADPSLADNSLAFQAASDFIDNQNPSNKTLYIPAGNYKFTNSVTFKSVKVVGEETRFLGTYLTDNRLSSGVLFYCDGATHFEHLTVEGKGNSSDYEDIMFSVMKNDVSFDKVNFLNVNVGIYYGGNNPLFYSSINRCLFINCSRNFLFIDNTSTPGVDLIISHTRFLGGFGERAWNFEEGLGSIICSDIQMSQTGSSATEQTVFFGTPAPAYGGSQFSNCVFEGNMVGSNESNFLLLGSSNRPWKEMHFTGCLFTGLESSAIQFGNVIGASFSACTFSSTNSQAIIIFRDFMDCEGLSFSDCRYESNNTQPVYKGANNTVAIYITNPVWRGSTRFADFSATGSNNLTLTIYGGSLGSNSYPVLTQDTYSGKVYVEAPNVNWGPLKKRVMLGSTDGTGNQTIYHSIPNLHRKVALVNAFVRGSDGEALPVDVQYVDGQSLRILSNEANARYRVVVMYNENQDQMWG